MLNRVKVLTRCRNPFDRPTADVLLSQHPFCDLDPNYNFADTELFRKIKVNSKSE